MAATQNKVRLGTPVVYINRHGHQKLGLITALPETYQPGEYADPPALETGEAHLWVFGPRNHGPRFNIMRNDEPIEGAPSWHPADYA